MLLKAGRSDVTVLDVSAPALALVRDSVGVMVRDQPSDQPSDQLGQRQGAASFVVADALALAQALLIVAVGTVMFGVSWGNPLAAAALIGIWALVGTGAGMASGTLFRTAEQATAIGPAVGIAFGMLGGCMWPLEIVPQSVRLAGHFTPHAWAVDAWVTLLSRGGGLADIAGYLGILAVYAVVLLGFASLRLRRSLVTP